MKLHHALIPAMLLCSLSPAIAVDWTHEYLGNYLPTDASTSPQWQEPLAPVNHNAFISDGALVIEATDLNGYLFYRMSGPAWTPGANGTTVEVRLKVEEMLPGAGYSQSFQFSTGTHGAIFVITGSSIVHGAFGGEFHSYSLDTYQFHDYRFTMSADGQLSLYVDDASDAVMSFAMTESPENYMDFGATTSFGGGTVAWERISWTNEGLFPPAIPEPSTVALLFGAGLLAAARLRPRRSA